MAAESACATKTEPGSVNETAAIMERTYAAVRGRPVGTVRRPSPSTRGPGVDSLWGRRPPPPTPSPMASPKPQSFANHAAWQPLYHFFASPVLLLYAAHTAWQAVQEPTRAHAFQAIVAAAIAAAVVASRIMALTVQNRVIRLEMRLRLREVLPAALHPRIRELGTKQLIALRFAGDAELPALVDRTLRGEFATPKDIKRAITDWQADWLRA